MQKSVLIDIAQFGRILYAPPTSPRSLTLLSTTYVEQNMISSKYIQKLRSEMASKVLESGDPGYDQSLVIDNGRIDLRPGVVAMCANAQDVITAYKFAIEHEMHFTVRGGGHSAAG